MLEISKRHLAKTLTWRSIGTLDTLFLSWLITGSLATGIQIGFLELFTKMLLYFAHERAWFQSKMTDSNKRHVLKTFSWRAVGTVDTFLLGWVITGNPLTGLKIGGSEVFTKMILYFLHEKLWYRINYGLNQRKKNI
jgi:uncharacterized membrane protein